MAEQILLDTPGGRARLHLDPAERPRALLVLGHGAGGTVTAPDLRALAESAPAAGIAVARVEQPYRVSGRRSPAPAPQLDRAWIAAVAAARRWAGTAVPLIVGGRSSGARVAARTVADTAACALLALAFPLVSPRGVSRQAELDGVAVPALVLQGDRDRFGRPSQTPLRRVHVLADADHSLRQVTAEIAAVTLAWVAEVLPSESNE